jgi:hypothetical protein
MTLPWVRIDSNLASHDKILALVHDPSPRRWQAAFSYVCAIGWSADRGTDGEIPPTALPFIHGTRTTSRLLVDHYLWEPNGHGGWVIHNFADRQITKATADKIRGDAQRAACVRWHGPDCWIDGVGCSRA